jgi:long-chain acyl-CoA synthetase
VLAGHASRPPRDDVALWDHQRRVTFAELAPLLDAQAAWLEATGAARFALLADNGCDWALADLALQQAGLLNVPVPGYFTDAQKAHILADAGIDGLLTDQPAEVARCGPDFASASSLPGTGLHLFRREAPESAPALPVGTVKITYTSGSTGTPKGVCLSAATLAAVAASLASVTEDLELHRHLCILPLPTLLENVAGIHAGLRAGTRCDIPSLATTGMGYGGLAPKKLTTAISQREPASLILVPELLRVLVQSARQGWQPPSSLRFVAVGGATVAAELLEDARRVGLPVYEGYGLSECGSVVCLNTPSSHRKGSVGRPLPHVRVSVDPNQQLVVSGPVMSGYLGDGQARTAGDNLASIPTGDLGTIDADGFVYVHGRCKNLLITSLGRNISPEWVERELQRESVIGAALVCGEARPWLAAIVSPAHPAITRDQIREAIASANHRLPDYARVQDFVLADEPFTFANGALTANGRLRRAPLLAAHAGAIAALYAEAAQTLKEPA